MCTSILAACSNRCDTGVYHLWWRTKPCLFTLTSVCVCVCMRAHMRAHKEEAALSLPVCQRPLEKRLYVKWLFLLLTWNISGQRFGEGCTIWHIDPAVSAAFTGEGWEEAVSFLYLLKCTMQGAGWREESLGTKIELVNKLWSKLRKHISRGEMKGCTGLL